MHDKKGFSQHFAPSIVTVFITITLTLLGLVVLASASQSFHQEKASIFYKQLISLGLAIGAMFFFARVPIERLKKYAPYIAAGALFLLIIVLVPGIGVRVNGAQRWINFGFVRLQISEFAKVALTLLMASYLSANQRNLRLFRKGFVIPVIIMTVPFLLIMLEPDFGTAFLCAIVGACLIFLSGVRLSFLLPSAFSGLLLFSVAIFLDPVRLKRITSFLDVESNRSDGAYQLWQGILAFGAGGIDGVGLGNGRQQLSFLPEAHTDFILPVIGEELGLIFTLAVVALYLTLFIIGIFMMRKAPDLYSLLLAVGSLLFIVLQALINIGVVTGLLPTKGMNLPFISYGGANLVVMFIFIGLLLNCFKQWNSNPVPEAKEV